LDLNSEEEKQRKEVRAKKFPSVGAIEDNEKEIPMELEKPDTLEQIKNVDASVKRRLDTLHMHGTDKMSNGAIFSYFSEYGATFIEWINDSSCNILFADNFTARRALIGLSKPIVLKGLLSSGKMGENQEEGDVDIEKTDTQSQDNESNSLIYWRKGKDWKDNVILLRFATVEDVRPEKPTKSKKLWLRKNQRNMISNSDDKNVKKRGLPSVSSIEVSAEEQEKRKLRRTKFGDIKEEKDQNSSTQELDKTTFNEEPKKEEIIGEKLDEKQGEEEEIEIV